MPWDRPGTLCWERGTAGPQIYCPLDLVSSGHRKNLIQSIFASKSKGKGKKVLDDKVKVGFCFKIKDSP